MEPGEPDIGLGHSPDEPEQDDQMAVLVIKGELERRETFSPATQGLAGQAR